MSIDKIDILLQETPEAQQQDIVGIEGNAFDGLEEYQEIPQYEEPVEDEGVDVAVLGPLTKGLAKAAKTKPSVLEKFEKKPVKENLAAKTEPEGPDLEPEEYFENLREQMAPQDVPATGKPPEVTFNLDRIETNDDVKRHIEYVSQKAGGVPEKVSFDDIANKVKAEGYSEKFISNIINVNSRIEANPEDVYRMMQALTDAAENTMSLAKKVDEAAEAKTLGPELMTEFTQALAFEGALSRGIKGKQADIARSLAIFNQARTADINRIQEMENVVNSYGKGGQRNVVNLAKGYMQSSKERGHRLAEEVYPMRKRIGDIIITNRINNVLSGPPTHLKNMLANLGHIVLDVGEKQIAAGIGKTRNLIFGSKDYLRQEEILMDIASWNQATAEAWALAKYSFKENRPIIGGNKVETRQYAKPYDIPTGPDSSKFMKEFAKGMQFMGKWQTMPGRFLMSEDEYFKAWNYRRSITSEAMRERQRYLDEMIDDPETKNVPYNELQQKADKYFDDILTTPEDYPALYKDADGIGPSIHEESVDYAQMMTFTKQLDGTLGKVGNFINRHPMLKQFALFYNTPIQIAQRVVKSTPAAPLMKSVRDDIKAGGIRRDLAVSRVVMGGGLVTSLGGLTGMGALTGAGPYNKEQRAVLEAQGWQPYSIVIPKNLISSEKIGALKEFTQVKEVEKHYYVSYAGLEPVGALAGMGATMGEYMFMDSDLDNLGDLHIALSAAVGDYASEVPVFKGVSDFMGLFSGNYKTREDAVDSLIESFSRKTSETIIGGTPGVGTYSSLLSYTNKILNEEKVSYRPDYVGYDDLPAYAKGFLGALQQYRANNPFFADKGSKPLDSITGEVKNHPTPEAYLRMLPFRISEGKYEPAYKILQILDIGPHQPDRSINGIDLTGEQINKWIGLATGKRVADEYFDGVRLKDMIVSTYNQDWFKELADEPKGKIKQRNHISRSISSYYTKAKEILIEENRSLARGVELKDIKLEKKLRKQAAGMPQTFPE